VKQSLILDTGSMFTGVPCSDFCDSCGTHENPAYNTTESGTV
jgi:hypothetical protein